MKGAAREIVVGLNGIDSDMQGNVEFNRIDKL
jgi:hypothetical protein